ncbi:MAG: deoxyguanosinetriphosphate triphosphohydrolase [Hyphomicrobiales bacterium]|nr:deoxyguanosinetriphosphate triphosphohydrolase [Hyphomicrobiales bacterium]
MNKALNHLAAYACDAAASRGRLVAEADSPTRSAFQRDRDRIIHATAFRRLAHKSQVFVPFEGDHFRTRLTHTIEVAQIARALARGLRLDDDLAEAVALAHDLGHPPFGHAGEDALRRVMAGQGGFDHNAQALRLVTRLEHRYAGFDGLNLTFESLEGMAKHNGPLLGTFAAGGSTPRPVDGYILEFDALFALDLAQFAGAEAQAAAIADDIAYNAHDLDDGLRAGLFTLEDLAAVPFLKGLLDEIAALHPGLATPRRIHELGRRVITRFIEDVLGHSAALLGDHHITSAAAVRAQQRAMVAFSPSMAEAERAIKQFLFARMYRHPAIMAVRREAESVLEALFTRFRQNPEDLPPEWRSPAADARAIADYIAGMTDRFAVMEHVRLFGSAPDLRADLTKPPASP